MSGRDFESGPQESRRRLGIWNSGKQEEAWNLELRKAGGDFESGTQESRK
jgi:hypothetical protein